MNTLGLGGAVRARRMEVGMRQGELARLAGVRQATVSKLEISGAGSDELLGRVAEQLATKPQALLTAAVTQPARPVRRLVVQRKAARLTLADVGCAVGCSGSYVSKMERGVVPPSAAYERYAMDVLGAVTADFRMPEGETPKDDVEHPEGEKT